LSAPSWPRNGNTVCTEPLPKDVRPISRARSRSCNAPATISDADALPWSTSTTIGQRVSDFAPDA
jgi:hypothetical protein